MRKILVEFWTNETDDDTPKRKTKNKCDAVYFREQKTRPDRSHIYRPWENRVKVAYICQERKQSFRDSDSDSDSASALDSDSDSDSASASDTDSDSASNNNVSNNLNIYSLNKYDDISCININRYTIINKININTCVYIYIYISIKPPVDREFWG